MRRYGTRLDEWQENVFEAAMGERADGMWAAKQVGLSAPRQNGKGTIEEARTLGGLLLFEEKLIICSAHEVRTAQNAFQRLKAYFENYDDLRKKVANIGNAVAREYIRLRNGQEVKFVTRSKSAIRGFTADCLLLDEAQILNDLQWEAILYTVSARPNHQIWLLGTPPTSDADGVVFTRFRERGIAGTDPRSAWLEWSAEPGSDLDDMHAAAQSNPALGKRILHETLLTERAVASDEGYGRERFGMWSTVSLQRVITADSWAVCAAPNLTDGGDEVAFAIDVAADRGSASICAASWTSDGLPFVDVVESRRGEPDWGIERLAAMCDRHDVRAVVIDAGSASASLIDPLRQRGVTVTTPTVRQIVAGCGGLFDDVMDGRLRHLDQPLLNSALAVARKRPIGDGGGWGWSRKNSESDITPLVAATLALWGLTSSEIEEKPRPRSGHAVFV